MKSLSSMLISILSSTELETSELLSAPPSTFWFTAASRHIHLCISVVGIPWFVSALVYMSFLTALGLYGLLQNRDAINILVVQFRSLKLILIVVQRSSGTFSSYFSIEQLPVSPPRPLAPTIPLSVCGFDSSRCLVRGVT